MTYTEKNLAVAVRARLAADAPDNWPVVIGSIRQLNADAATAITPFPVEEDDEVGTVVEGLNVHMRAATKSGSNALLDEAERVRLSLLGLCMTTLAGMWITVVWRDRATPLNLDDRGRFERIDTYYVRTDRLGRAA